MTDDVSHDNMEVEMEDKLTNVHEALNRAATAPSSPQIPMEQYSFRMKEDMANKVKDICDRHGTTMSEFLRHCCEGLISDYQG